MEPLSAPRWTRKTMRTMQRGLIAAAGALTLDAAPARADAELPSRGSQPAAETADPPLPEKDQGPRPLPEYRPLPSAPARRLLWIPRVLLAPAYVACHLVATPVAAAVVAVERYRWRQRLHDFFTFGPRDQFGVYPAGYVDLGFRPTAGIYSFWKDPLRPNDVHIRVTSGGRDHWDARALWHSRLGSGGLELMARYTERDDRAFHGLGRESSPSVARYGERGVEARAEDFDLKGAMSNPEHGACHGSCANRRRASQHFDRGYLFATGRQGRFGAAPMTEGFPCNIV